MLSTSAGAEHMPRFGCVWEETTRRASLRLRFRAIAATEVALRESNVNAIAARVEPRGNLDRACPAARRIGRDRGQLRRAARHDHRAQSEHDDRGELERASTELVSTRRGRRERARERPNKERRDGNHEYCVE